MITNLRSWLASTLDRWWYRRASPLPLLLPLGWIFAGLSSARRGLYGLGAFRSVRVDARIVVVGTIVAGGSGKTPLVAWLARRLSESDVRVGIVSRGYGAADRPARVVGSDSNWVQVGDEALWLARATGVPVAVGRDRVAAARLLMERYRPELILSDDGLQHYRLARDAEIVTLDAARRLGNGALIPAGPLREPLWRVARVDAVVLKGDSSARIPAGVPAFRMTWRLGDAFPVTGGTARALADFRGRVVHALAGIANPEGFFRALERRGLTLVRHPLADHADGLRELDAVPPAEPILMTDKDAVKYEERRDNLWRVPLEVAFSESDATQLVALVRGLETRR